MCQVPFRNLFKGGRNLLKGCDDFPLEKKICPIATRKKKRIISRKKSCIAARVDSPSVWQIK